MSSSAAGAADVIWWSNISVVPGHTYYFCVQNDSTKKSMFGTSHQTVSLRLSESSVNWTEAFDYTSMHYLIRGIFTAPSQYISIVNGTEISVSMYTPTLVLSNGFLFDLNLISNNPPTTIVEYNALNLDINRETYVNTIIDNPKAIIGDHIFKYDGPLLGIDNVCDTVYSDRFEQYVHTLLFNDADYNYESNLHSYQYLNFANTVYTGKLLSNRYGDIYELENGTTLEDKTAGFTIDGDTFTLYIRDDSITDQSELETGLNIQYASLEPSTILMDNWSDELIKVPGYIHVEIGSDTAAVPDIYISKYNIKNIGEVIDENEKVTAAALVDLNDRLETLSGNVETGFDSVSELKSNKTTTIDNTSTNTQYPSAKAVYDLIASLEARITALEGNS